MHLFLIGTAMVNLSFPIHAKVNLILQGRNCRRFQVSSNRYYSCKLRVALYFNYSSLDITN